MNPLTLIIIQVASYLLFILIGAAVMWFLIKSFLKIRDKTNFEFDGTDSEVLKVGEVTLSSKKYCVNQLGTILTELLKDKNVQKYLDIIKIKKTSGANYTG